MRTSSAAAARLSGAQSSSGSPGTAAQQRAHIPAGCGVAWPRCTPVPPQVRSEQEKHFQQLQRILRLLALRRLVFLAQQHSSVLTSPLAAVLHGLIAPLSRLRQDPELLTGSLWPLPAHSLHSSGSPAVVLLLLQHPRSCGLLQCVRPFWEVCRQQDLNIRTVCWMPVLCALPSPPYALSAGCLRCVPTHQSHMQCESMKQCSPR